MASGSKCLNRGVLKEDGLGDTTKEISHAGRKPVQGERYAYAFKKLFVEIEQN